MAKENFCEFQKANDYIVNKDVYINSFVRQMLVRTQSMFCYAGLPDTIPARILEYRLQTKGHVFITKESGNLYAFIGSYSGEPDVYDECKQYTVTNPALKLSKTYDIGKDGVIVKNDALEIGLLPILLRYGAMLCENTISIRTVDIMLRMTALISASDDKTQASAEKFIKDIENGKISSVGESAFFQGVKVQGTANTQNYLTQFIELEQYLKASCLNEIGLNANYNMKRTSLSSNESALNDDFLLPLVDDMIRQREKAITDINEMFGTEITIDYSSAWKANREESQKQIALAQSIQEMTETGEADLEVNQKRADGDANQPIIKLDPPNPDPDTAPETPDTAPEQAPQEPEQEPETTDPAPEQEPDTAPETPDTAPEQEPQEPEQEAENVEEKEGENDDRNKG